jgi:hypothetical protein
MDYIETTTELDFSLNEPAREKWRRFCNKAYTGDAEIPLSVNSSDIPQELKDVHWYINCGRRVTLHLKLYGDGSLEILPVGKLSKSKLPL